MEARNTSGASSGTDGARRALEPERGIRPSAAELPPFLQGKQGRRPTITVLMCTINEQESLPHVLPKVPQWVDEVLMVDGGSSDRTVEIACALRPDIRILRQPGKGKGDAIKCGVRESKGDIVITLDADGETDPDDLARFIEPLMDGFDFVKGSRLARGRPVTMQFHRWVGNKILAWTYNVLHGTRYTDVASGYYAFRRRAFLDIDLSLDGFEMDQEMLVKVAKSGLKVTEVFHRTSGRIAGVSKLPDIKAGFTAWWIIIREWVRS